MMVTDYARIIELGATFEQYLWHCVRAVYHYSDDVSASALLDSPQMQLLEERAAEATRRIVELEAMTLSERASCARRYNDVQLLSFATRVLEQQTLRERVRAMSDRIDAWRPRTSRPRSA